MTTAPAKKRPLSPHLGIYKPQISSGMSIFHRATGVGLALGLPVFVAWLVMLAGGPRTYDWFISLFHNIIGQVLLFGWSWAFFYHFCCGIRHLCWDAGWFLSIRGMRITGYLALAVSTLLTLGVWLQVWGILP